MNIAQIEINLQKLVATINKETFIFDLLLAYGLPKASITRLQKGNLNMSKTEGEISWKKKLFFREEDKSDLHITVSELAKNITHNERFVVVTDYKTLLAIDTKTQDKLDCQITDLAKHYDFFLPWSGMEKAQHANENPADVKAAEKMAKLFDVIKKDNPDDSPEFIHGLNVFLSRLLFCYFAEDTHIFEDCQFTNAIDSHTQADGSDLNTYLDNLFVVLNTPGKQRENLPEYLNAFPYVNGGLFKDTVLTPVFSRSSRAALLNSGDQDWSAINPDIFGSMFQAVISVDQRGNLGQHYTSVPNIMKVIEPLFLNELYEELEKAGTDQKKLKALLNRIHKLKIFDPACGSGNFLIIAYKELRLLEMKIFKAGGMMALSGIQLSQFYGIEIDDFAGEIAKLALWLAEHQMNVEFYKEFGRANPTLPLSEAGHIVQGNATRLNWEDVCPKKKDDEIYILGNPPYLGSKEQSVEQKLDMDFVFNGWGNYKKLDYIACWFKKATDFIRSSRIKYAFVSTNSICQGEQVSILWPYIVNYEQEIFYAYPSFHWKNNAKDKAGVTVIIVGVNCNRISSKKSLFYENRIKEVPQISPYLIQGENICVFPRNESLSKLPEMIRGSQPTDNGNLILSKEEALVLREKYPEVQTLLKKFMGADDFINNKERWCLWMNKESVKISNGIPEIEERLKNCAEFRAASKKEATRKKAQIPYSFDEIKHKETQAIIFPVISSHRRKYIPVGFINSDTIISNKGQVVYNAEPYMFGILTSAMHMTWLKTTSSRMRMDYQYSKTLSYNTFPFPSISTQRKNEITQSVFRILEEREKHSDKTMAELYDPDKMPEGLREAHRQNDIIIEKCYRSTPFNSDEERLEYLFKLYEKMIAEEQAKGTLFAKEKKTRKKK
ncbi:MULTISPECIES: class I SAM-dependent DNA methyltransferase [unclassified Carboxylicivirga]|uniref:class I SAM-dependent DNA methyltransferase n=1 Tax=Carboxylicivirga TaxID=1628153 RepID=UPI003D358026